MPDTGLGLTLNQILVLEILLKDFNFLFFASWVSSWGDEKRQ